MFTIRRSDNNPILSPNKHHPWEALAAFNGAPIKMSKDLTAMVYRAMPEPDPYKEAHNATSTIGVAFSTDGGQHFTDRQQLIVPDTDFDRYGCEDPRVTKIDGLYYIFYTALGGYPFNGSNIKVAVAISKDMKTIISKHLVTPFNAKAMALFPKKIHDKYVAMLTINTDLPPTPSQICYAEFNSIEEIWDQNIWKKWYAKAEKSTIQLRRKDDDQIELGAVPVYTDKGWLAIYSHIQHYGSEHPIFGVEAVLLDLSNPKKIIGRTKGPFLVPDWYYEKIGQVAQIVFPTGVIIEKNRLDIYYGAADTHCAIASGPLDTFLESLTKEAITFTRYKNNPIISPRPGYTWEAGGTLNPATIDLGDKVHILYRAATTDNVSTIGYANSKNGLKIDERLDTPIYSPRADFESHGCEDPRLMQIKDTLYLIYTAYNGSVPRIAVSTISSKDFLKKDWTKWSMPAVITSDRIPDKDAAFIPEKINGQYMIIHRAGLSICADFFPDLNFEKEQVTKGLEIIGPRKGMWDGEKVGMSCPPIKTKKGWLMIYHGVSSRTKYRVGALLLDLNDPTTVLARTSAPIFEPETEYESNGVVNNVVFPCGTIMRDKLLYLYYGAADKVVGVATIPLDTVLHYLKTE